MNLRAKILTITIAYFGLFGLEIFFWNNPSREYEISIYTSLPQFLWITLIVIIGYGILQTIHNAINIQKNKLLVFINILLVFLSILIVFLLPTIRNYVTYGRWDMLIHIGYTLDIISSGHISDANIYPLTHILNSELALLTKISPTKLLTLNIAFFWVLYVIFIYCLAKAVFVNKLQKITLSILISIIPTLSYTNYQVLPTTISIFILPLILWLNIQFIQTNNIKFLLILMILLVTYPFLHPLMSLILVFALIVVGSFKMISSRSPKNIQLLKYTVISAATPLIIMIPWIYIHNKFWNVNIASIILTFKGYLEGSGLSETSDIVTALKETNLTGLDLIVIFIKMYGHVAVLLLITTVAVLSTTLVVFKKEKNQDSELTLLFILTGWFIATESLLIVNIALPLLHIGFWRFLAPIIIISPIFVGVWIFNVITHNQRRPYIISIIITLLFVVGIFNLYPSPYTFQLNQQVTIGELNGAKWHYIYKDKLFTSRLVYPADYRLFFAIAGFNGISNRRDFARGDTEAHIFTVPDHFGYTNIPYSSHISPAYIIVLSYDKAFYIKLYPTFNKFNEADFEILLSDFIVNKVYSNSDKDIEIYIVIA